jgi:hypothetical protein
MMDFCVQRTGMSVSYIELSTIGVAVTFNQVAKIICVVDLSDGPDFAKVIALQLLTAFTNKFAAEINQKITSPDTFSQFNSNISSVIRQSVRPVMEQLSNVKGMLLCFLTSGHGHSIIYSQRDVDKISVLANHARLIDLANEIMGNRSDSFSAITMKNDKTTLMLFRLVRSSFVVVFKNLKKSGKNEVCAAESSEASILIRKLLVMASNLTGERLIN